MIFKNQNQIKNHDFHHRNHDSKSRFWLDLIFENHMIFTKIIWFPKIKIIKNHKSSKKKKPKFIVLIFYVCYSARERFLSIFLFPNQNQNQIKSNQIYESYALTGQKINFSGLARITLRPKEKLFLMLWIVEKTCLGVSRTPMGPSIGRKPAKKGHFYQIEWLFLGRHSDQKLELTSNSWFSANFGLKMTNLQEKLWVGR